MEQAKSAHANPVTLHGRVSATRIASEKPQGEYITEVRTT